MPKILFVCLGNICRSPAAEGIARVILPKDKFEKIDSAGIGNWHIGQKPNPNMCKVAAERGFPIDDLRARQISRYDFEDFDLIVGMDSENMQALEYMKREYSRPSVKSADVLKLLDVDVPDPYYGGMDGFYMVFDMIKGGVMHLAGN